MPTTTANPLVVFLALLGAGAVAVVYSLARFWGANPEYVDRFLIVAGSAYIVREAWPSLRTLTPKPTHLGYAPLLLGAVAFPVGWFLQVQVAPRPIVLWWITAAWVAAASGAVLLVGGWSQLRRVAFPLGFVLFALPVPNRILLPLQFFLQTVTTTVAAWALPLLGITIERNGFILSLPGGDLGVAEACSGVRSVTALTAIAAFEAWRRSFLFPRGLALVVLSVPVIAGVNVVRVVLSGLIQEHVGVEYVRGDWHEGLGVLMIFLGLGLTVGLGALMQPGKEPETVTEPGPLPPPPAPLFAVLLTACSALAAAAAQFLGQNAEQEIVAAAPVEQIPMRLDRWTGSDLPVPPEVAELLTPDAITRRVYSDLGYEVHVWVIFWSSKNMVKGYHHPDVCWPNRGFKLDRRDTVEIPAGGVTIPLTVREFSRSKAEGAGKPGDRNRQLVAYWTQEGQRVWTEEDEAAARGTGGATHEWLGDRLFRPASPTPTGRIVVLLGTQLWGDGDTIRRQTFRLAGLVGAELYRVCPWATPAPR